MQSQSNSHDQLPGPNATPASTGNCIYNTLPLMDPTSPLLPLQHSPSVLKALHSLLQRYNLHTHFGIVLLHRHFTLSGPEEKLVDIPGPGIIVSTVFTHGKPDPDILRDYKLPQWVPREYEVVPARFVVSGETLVPYEFKCVPRGRGGRSRDTVRRYGRGRVERGFLRGWGRVLRSHGVEGGFGIAVLEGQQAIEGEGCAGVEYTDLERRVSIVMMGGAPSAPRTGYGLGGGGLKGNEFEGGYVPTLWQDGRKEATRMCHCGG